MNRQNIQKLKMTLISQRKSSPSQRKEVDSLGMGKLAMVTTTTFGNKTNNPDCPREMRQPAIAAIRTS